MGPPGHHLLGTATTPQLTTLTLSHSLNISIEWSRVGTPDWGGNRTCFLYFSLGTLTCRSQITFKSRALISYLHLNGFDDDCWCLTCPSCIILRPSAAVRGNRTQAAVLQIQHSTALANVTLKMVLNSHRNCKMWILL